MKFLTFVNYAYIDIVHNLYLQLKKFNRHKDLIITCTDDETKIKLIQQIQNCECEILQYQPVLFKETLSNYQSHLSDKNYAATHLKSASYSIYQFLKHDVLYQNLIKHESVCLLDADIIVFEDFVDPLMYWMNNNKKFKYSDPTLFGFKYYLQGRICVDINKKESLYHWSGREQVINTGFLYLRINDITIKHLIDYTKLFVPHFGQINNLDEFILTEYFRNVDENITSIPDQINLVSNVGTVYSPEEVLKLKPMTFHPTFTGNKIQFMKDCKQWLL